jgi:RNA polymerase sigma-70 factor (ECF subfamily)
MDASRDWEQLFEGHHRMVVQSAYRITGNVEDAEDVLQTVFARLLSRSDPLEPEVVRPGYLQRAAVNAALDIIRSRRAGQSRPLDDVEHELVGKSEQRPDLMENHTELKSWLRVTLARLSVRAAEAFVLKCIEGYTNEEVAQFLGTSPGTVAVTVHRARKQLRHEIESFLGGTQ